MVRITQEDEQELVAQARQGDQQAITRLYEALAPHITMYLYGTVDPELVEDAVQEAMFKVFSRLDQFKGGSRFSTWCIRVALNTALDMTRAARDAARTISIDSPTSTDDGGSMTFDLGYEDRTAEKNLAYETIHKGIDKLSERHQTALRMYLDGSTTSAIAKELRVPENYAKQIVRRAKIYLREAIEGGAQ